jgi:hypothetical protein
VDAARSSSKLEVVFARFVNIGKNIRETSIGDENFVSQDLALRMTLVMIPSRREECAPSQVGGVPAEAHQSLT